MENDTRSWLRKFAVLATVTAALAIGGAATAAPARAGLQPPMNSFDFAFYTCDGGKAFQISYDSDTPKVATVTTSNNNKQYVLTRKPDPEAAVFTNGAVRFWTNGKRVVVEGVSTPLQNCKMSGA